MDLIPKKEPNAFEQMMLTNSEHADKMRPSIEAAQKVIAVWSEKPIDRIKAMNAQEMAKAIRELLREESPETRWCLGMCLDEKEDANCTEENECRCIEYWMEGVR